MSSGSAALRRRRATCSVELLDRRRRGWTLALEARRDLLCRTQHPQYVAAGKLSKVGFAPPAPGELGEQRRIGRHVLESDDVLVDPVEVAADSDMIHAGDLLHVLDCVGDVGNGRLRPRMGRTPGG